MSPLCWGSNPAPPSLPLCPRARLLTPNCRQWDRQRRAWQQPLLVSKCASDWFPVFRLRREALYARYLEAKRERPGIALFCEAQFSTFAYAEEHIVTRIMRTRTLTLRQRDPSRQTAFARGSCEHRDKLNVCVDGREGIRSAALIVSECAAAVPLPS